MFRTLTHVPVAGRPGVSWRLALEERGPDAPVHLILEDGEQLIDERLTESGEHWEAGEICRRAQQRAHQLLSKKV